MQSGTPKHSGLPTTSCAQRVLKVHSARNAAGEPDSRTSIPQIQSRQFDTRRQYSDAPMSLLGTTLTARTALRANEVDIAIGGAFTGRISPENCRPLRPYGFASGIGRPGARQSTEGPQ
jgi:hypothetical protein